MPLMIAVLSIFLRARCRMSRIDRSHEPPQPVLALGHGPIQWSTLPEPVRERVLTLWMQLLTEHLAHEGASRRPGGLLIGPGDQPTTERHP